MAKLLSTSTPASNGAQTKLTGMFITPEARGNAQASGWSLSLPLPSSSLSLPLSCSLAVSLSLPRALSFYAVALHGGVHTWNNPISMPIQCTVPREHTRTRAREKQSARVCLCVRQHRNSQNSGVCSRTLVLRGANARSAWGCCSRISVAPSLSLAFSCVIACDVIWCTPL